jgi:TonB family protein
MPKWICLALLAFTQIQLAHAGPVEPACDKVQFGRLDIPGFVGAEPTYKPYPRYPKKQLENASDGWALLQFEITAQGAVRDMSVIDALGSREFVDASAKAVASWRFKPARRSGSPVDQNLFQTYVLYLNTTAEQQSPRNPNFAKKYNRAKGWLDVGRVDDAVTLLEAAFKERLNLHEQVAASFLLAVAYAKKNDFLRAHVHIRHAALENYEYVGPDSRAPAISLHVELETRTGNLAEALCAFEAMPDEGLRGESSAAKAIVGVRTALKDAGPLPIEAQLAVHPAGQSAVWGHRLLRRKFSFAEVKGEVSGFRLACIGAKREGAVDTVTQWSVPPEAGPCVLRVEGAPGATFKLIETW